MNLLTRHIFRNGLLCLFFLSGLSGLIYQSVWSHYLKLVLGHAAYSQTLVLIIFMGGLSLGAWLASRFSPRVAMPLVWYAIIELVIGLFGLLFHNEFLFAHKFVFGTLINISDSPGLSDVLKWVGTSLVIFPQSILLGATFPLLSAALVRNEKQHSGYIIGALYFSNSIGAAIGVLLSGFVFIEWLGLPGTSFVAGSINVLVALGAWLIFKSAPDQFMRTQPTSVGTVFTPATTSQNTPIAWALMGIALLTGVASFFYEVGWIRMLSLVIGSTIQAFELMLCAFILGLAFGSFYIRKRIDSLKSPLFYLAVVQLLMGLMATATLPLYVKSYAWIGAIFNALAESDEGYFVFNLSAQTIALIIMFPASFMAGMTLPLLTKIMMTRCGGESAIGRIYAANTLGAIIGVVLAIHVIMPLLGVKSLIVLGSFIDIALGIVIFVVFARSDLSKKRALGFGLGTVLALAFSLTPFQDAVLSSGVYRTGVMHDIHNLDLKFYRDGKTSSVAYIETEGGGRQLRTNGKTDAHLHSLDKPYGADEITMVMLATVPLSVKPDATHIANIGLGSGLTTHVLLGSKTLEAVDTIEIETSVVDASRMFGPRVARAHSDSRSRIYIDDAKSYFASSRKVYDIIVSEPSNPWMSGIASLYSVEFYRYVQQFLNDDGVFVQWLHLYESNMGLVSSVMKAMGAAFPHYKIYNTNDADIIIVASKKDNNLALDPWIFSELDLKADLDRVELRSLADLQARYLGDKRTLGPLFSTYPVPANSDFYPYLGYKAPKAFHLKQSARELVAMHDARIPVLDWVNDSSPIQLLPGRSQHFKVSEKLTNALALTDEKVGDTVDPNLKLVAMATDVEFSDNFSESDIVNAMQELAISVNPYLPLSRLDMFWRNKLSSFERFNSEQIEQWTRLHYAISQKDSAKTLAQGERLLAEKFPVNNEQKQYIAIAMLTASVAAGDFAISRELIQRFDLAVKLESLPLELRLLVAMALRG